MQSKEFLKLIGAPWAAYHDHPDPETARDYAQIRPVKRVEHGYETAASIYGCDYHGIDGQVQRARRDLIAAAPDLYAYAADMAAQGDTQAKMLLQRIHGDTDGEPS